MPSAQMGLSSYERGRGGLPELPVINMVAEEAPTEGVQAILQSRPGMRDNGVQMGAGPVQALFQRDNVLGGVLFGVSNGELYQAGTRLGAIDGADPASIAGYENFVFAAAGGQLWGWNGTTLAAIAFPDNASVAKVVIGASRLIVVREDTGKFYWSPPLGTTIDALAFATAESQPDRLKDALFLDDFLILFGAETVELWANTGGSDLPFQPLEGNVIEKGIKATGCAAQIGNTFAWVTNQNQVCLTTENGIISNPGLQKRIGEASEVSLFAFLIDGVEYLALRLDDETQVWSYRTKLWGEFTSYGFTNWLPRCHANGVLGSAVNGQLIEWFDGYSDFGGVLERRWRAGFPMNSGGVKITNVQVRCDAGQTGFLEGDYAEPVLEMRLTRDAGKTFGEWRQTSLGRQGEYRTRVMYRACGMASQPGFLAEFRVTAPIDFRASDVLVNEPWGGRA